MPTAWHRGFAAFLLPGGGMAGAGKGSSSPERPALQPWGWELHPSCGHGLWELVATGVLGRGVVQIPNTCAQGGAGIPVLACLPVQSHPLSPPSDILGSSPSTLLTTDLPVMSLSRRNPRSHWQSP